MGEWVGDLSGVVKLLLGRMEEGDDPKGKQSRTVRHLNR